MRVTPIGKVAILIVILGLIGAIVRMVTGSPSQATNQPSFSNNSVSTPQGSQPNLNASLTLSVQTSGTYQDYLEKLANQWQSSHQSVAIRVLPPKESRDALHFILDREKNRQEADLPDVWLASSDALVQNLGAATKAKSASFANLNDTRTYAIWPPQPMVVLCKIASRDRLSEIFSSAQPMERLDGSLKFSFPDPLTSGGGHSALGFCRWSWQKQSKVKSFGDYLQSIRNRGYTPLAAPSGGLANDFASSSLDFILIHNALADREVAKNQGTLAKVVPAVTVSERPSSIALRPASGWSAEKERALQDFTEFLRRNPPFTGQGALEDAQVPEHLDSEKQTWERVFDQGARLGNINSPANLPAHPR